jgi:hypothetical protein
MGKKQLQVACPVKFCKICLRQKLFTSKFLSAWAINLVYYILRIEEDVGFYLVGEKRYVFKIFFLQ